MRRVMNNRFCRVNERLVALVPLDAIVGTLSPPQHLHDHPSPRRAAGHALDLEPITYTSCRDVSLIH